MGEKSDQIEQHIYDKRNELGENIHELQEKVRDTVHKVRNSVDWRSQFQERPMTLIGIAFAGGLAASALFRRSRPASNSSYASFSTERRNAEAPSASTSDRRAKDWQNKAAGAWADIKGAVIGLAATKVGSALEEILPGFQEHYQKRQEERRSATNGSAERARTAPETGGAGYLRQS